MKIFIFALFWLLGIQFATAEYTQSSFYGYFQSDFIQSSNPDHEYGFLLKRINFIGDFLPNTKTRLLTDIEFEEGADISANEVKGNIKISRLFAEQSISKSFRIRIGKYLTPFGLYNEIHDFSVAYYGAEVPVIYRPLVVSTNSNPTQLISKYNTGVWLTGNTTGRNKMEYDLYFGNGRDETLAGSDKNKSQSFGLKIAVFPGSKRNLNLGLSYYQDQNTEGLAHYANDSEKSFALHTQFENPLFQIQGEVISTRYHNSSKESESTLGSYSQIAFNLTDKNTLYYQHGEIIYNSKTKEALFENLIGTGYYVNPQFILKMEYQNFKDDHSLCRTYNETYLSAAMAF
jgi:hypothetical protein